MKVSRKPTAHKSIVTLIVLLLAGLILITMRAPTRTGTRSTATNGSQVKHISEQAGEAFGQMELSFEANEGQTDDSVNFLARGAGYTLFLKPTEAVFRLRNGESRVRNDQSRALSGTIAQGTDANRRANPQSEIRPTQSKVLRMKLVGADAGAAMEGTDELAGKVNYFIGNDPSLWRPGVSTYGRVRYREVYPGIDLVYYGNQKQLEYDFIVAPGRDPRAVSLQFDGADKVEVDGSGDLLLSLDENVLRQPKPVVYQDVAGVRRAIDGGYSIRADQQIGFTIGDYDPSLPLVIDPVLVYSTYLGGSGLDFGTAIALDSSSSVYIAGITTSTDFPTANAFQAASAGTDDAFVTKLDPQGTALVYSTYLGGGSTDQANSIAVDTSGNAYIAGFTASTNFPTANAIQTAHAGSGDAFVTKLNAAGSALVFSTYHGGTDPDFGFSIAVNSAGAAYVTGSTFSTNFPTVSPIQAAKGGGMDDAFLTKFNPAGTARVYSTYLGGNGSDAGLGVAVDSSGNTYIAGDTSSSNFPTANAIQVARAGSNDAFVTKVNDTGSALAYSTYLGGSLTEGADGVAIDSAGNAYVTGATTSTDFPMANALQGTYGGGVADAFVTKLNAAGTALVYSTYLGGAGGERSFGGIAVDPAGNAYVVGGTDSITFPTARAVQCASAGSEDGFITKLNAAGTALAYSTYLGGGLFDRVEGVAVDFVGNVFVVGDTDSTNFPTVNPIQSLNAGFDDGFIAKIVDTSAFSASTLEFTQATYNVDEDVTVVNLTVQRTGNTMLAVTVDYATVDGTASERSDYTTAIGTLSFDADETSKTIGILVNEDSRFEGTELFRVDLSNPTGGASLNCSAASATIQINDDSVEPSTNAIDDSAIFVGQHYHDFLNRQADAGGQAFWANQIAACGADAACLDQRRTAVSTAFFLSIEFQRTGFEVIRIYRASFIDRPARPRALPRYSEFLRDTQEMQRGVVVGVGDWEQQLDDNRSNFARGWVQRADFTAEFPFSMSADDYINKLFARSGVTPTPAEFNIAFDAYDAGHVEGRAQALLAVTGSGSVFNTQFNPAFVLMQYIGYLRRNPNDAPEAGLNYAGFDFWLTKMNQFSAPGDDVRNEQAALARVQRAEMVRAFIVSDEYRGRFGP